MSLTTQRAGSHTATTLLFDWDGTIVDSAMSSFLTFQKALEHVGVPFTWEQFEAHFTPDWHRMYEAVGLDASRFREADAAWKANYPCVTYQPVEGAPATLTTLRARGYRLGVVTSGSRWRLMPEISDFGMAGIFDVVICNEDVQRRKPHPEGIHRALAELSCATDCCAYVGDVPEDVLAGKNAGVRTVGIHGRYPTSRRLVEAQPDIHLSSFVELLEHFPSSESSR
jgi:HAD superfamily hydrolase (TIGR01509 family)